MSDSIGPVDGTRDAATVAAARREVAEARADVAEQILRMEGSVRAAVDIPARIRRQPAKVAGLAAGIAFLGLGGPRRVLRGFRRAVLGPSADLPKSMLPGEVDRELRKLGSDGDRVRATLEREFTSYLDERSSLRRERDLTGTVASLAGNLLRPASVQAGKRLAERLLDPDGATISEGIQRARRRRETDSRVDSSDEETAGQAGPGAGA
jgi:hypothetical protein